jgi:hypothetical protein
VNLQNIAAIAHRRGDLDEAAAGFARALSIKTVVLGADHPELATTLVNLGVVHRDRRRPARAATAFRRAGTVLAPVVPPDHPLLTAARRHLAALKTAAPRMRVSAAR